MTTAVAATSGSVMREEIRRYNEMINRDEAPRWDGHIGRKRRFSRRQLEQYVSTNFAEGDRSTTEINGLVERPHHVGIAVVIVL